MADREPDNLASRSDPNRLVRHVQSRLIRALIGTPGLRARRRVREALRRVRGRPHQVHYVHEVEDPYSHLAVQALLPLAERYAIEWVVHLAAPANWPEIPEPELLASLARRDCQAVAPHYGLSFAAGTAGPTGDDVAHGQAALSAALREGPEVFAKRAVLVGDALWGGEEGALATAVASFPRDDAAAVQQTLEAGRDFRARHGHYSGATFLYEGEWYWGVDRLYHLELRLDELGASKGEGAMAFPRPELEMAPVPRGGEMTLEIFPSLRSPYTAIGLEPALDLVDRTGVGHVLRPVLPMVMRGVPVTMAKGLYIMSDTKREAAALGMPFGRLLDPIGEPVKRAFSLWPWAEKQGRGRAYLTSFLRAAFAEGVDTSTDAGLRSVVERAGLRWADAVPQIGESAWEAEVERNRLALVDEMGQWGVPSFRLRGPAGFPDVCCWGQDRLWLISRVIQERGRASGEGAET